VITKTPQKTQLDENRFRIMSTATASQPVAAHQLGSNLNAGTAVSQKADSTAKLSGPVEAELSFFVPPEDGSAVCITCQRTFSTQSLMDIHI
jgi:hypothetical protein